MGAAASLIIARQLARKQENHHRFLSFLFDTQVGDANLWSHLGSIGGGEHARSLLADHSEKLAASVGLRKLQQQGEP